MSALPILLSLYFFYDWKVGYPKKLAIWKEYRQFTEEGRSNDWVAYANEKGYPQKPDEMTDAKIQGQFWWGVGTGILGLTALVYYLLNFPRKLTADSTSLTTPWGRRIPFSSISRIDKRKWENKGLALLTYSQSNKSAVAVIDDLRFRGADKILARIEENFEGEVYTLAPEPEPERKSE
jgi:hypothetical protein